MYVCICHGITDRQIRETLNQGANSFSDVQLRVPVGGCCGRCVPVAQELVEQHLTNSQQRSSCRAA